MMTMITILGSENLLVEINLFLCGCLRMYRRIAKLKSETLSLSNFDWFMKNGISAGWKIRNDLIVAWVEGEKKSLAVESCEN
jgi:hypothetical protein